MKIPKYENQVSPAAVNAARPKAVEPVRGAFGEQIAQASENLSRSVLHLAGASEQMADQNQRALERQALRERNLRKTAAILNWRKDNDELLNGKMNEDGSRVAGGFLTTEYSQAAGITKSYDEQGRALMKKYLDTAPTDEERQEWALAFQQDFQNNFDAVAQHQYKQQRAQGDLLTNAYLSQQEGLAGAVKTPQQMRVNLDDSYNEYNANATTKALPTEQQKLARYGIANKNITAAVSGNVFNDDLPAARSVLESAKNDLLPDDYNKLNNFLAKAEATYQKAAEAEQMGPLYERALKMAENRPEDLQEEIVSLLRNPSSALGTYEEKYGPMKAKQLLEYANWVQRNLLDSQDTRAGKIKAANWQNHENGFNAFEWKKNKDGSFKIQNKEMRNPQTLLASIGALQGHIEHHDFNADDMKSAQKHLAQLRAALGTMDIKANDTALGEVVRQANLLSGGITRRVETGEVARRPVEIDGIGTGVVREMKLYDTYNVGGFLSPEEKSLIIEQTAQFLQAANVNLLAEDRNTKMAAVNAVQTVARDYVRSKFAIVRDDITDVQVGDNTFKSYGIKPNPNLGAAITSNLDGYRYEEQNGAAYLVKRDKNGNELHRQLL